MALLKFTKMQALGKDFMIIDGIHQSFTPTPLQIQRWGHRHLGVGFDQLMLIEKPQSSENDFKYRIFDSMGEEIKQCANAPRCFMRFITDKNLIQKTKVQVETAQGVIIPEITNDGLITVELKHPRFSPQDIPFATKTEALSYPLLINNETHEISCVNIGNPHVVLLVDDILHAPVNELGALIESDPRFAQRVNVNFAQIINESELSVRTFERKIGETLACGSGACAAVIAGIRLGKLKSTVTVYTRGGELEISWQEGKAVKLSGPAVTVFEGSIHYE